MESCQPNPALSCLHDGKKRNYCARCCVNGFSLQEFTNDHRRKNHLIKVHGETPPFQCDECTYWCLYEGQMKSHKQTHMKKRGLLVGPNNESLYTSCHICGKNISGKPSSTGFQDHLRTHEEGGPTFPCDHAGCGQIFKSRSTMKR